ncbi:hypothetical protein [Fimbriimonas ginsengisoli]|uniref:Uncharacterized protein n=1 Tax=Fimbriimonas ginsengisoli Gsoil 348 TaxID=661478 RepID=A0A068NQB5_FIMGI|nr:hypothetical protein [Fimbriimonas ginsengisoli]AIE85537.1 hypothetical protein OP10G_2169 [Fimbriimonas ginsengisoli Gsoil 348]
MRGLAAVSSWRFAVSGPEEERCWISRSPTANRQLLTANQTDEVFCTYHGSLLRAGLSACEVA